MRMKPDNQKAEIQNTKAIQAEAQKSVDLISYQTNHIKGGTTMRNLSLPENGNQALHVCLNPNEVMKNREVLAQMTLPLEQWALPWQKHTDKFYRATKEDLSKGSLDKNTSIMDVDALFTTEPEVLIGVYTADCLGILVADDTTPLVCVIHSGWKGTAQNIVYKTLSFLIKEGLLHPESTQVFFSPSILQNSFEIGPEVKDQLLNAGKEINIDYSDLFVDGEGDRSYVDHQTMNIRVLEKLGIPTEQIHPSTIDTKTSLEAFSFRRDGSKTGEHFTFGWIQKED